MEKIVRELIDIRNRINQMMISAISRDDVSMIDNLNDAVMHIDNAIKEIRGI